MFTNYSFGISSGMLQRVCSLSFIMFWNFYNENNSFTWDDQFYSKAMKSRIARFERIFGHQATTSWFRNKCLDRLYLWYLHLDSRRGVRYFGFWTHSYVARFPADSSTGSIGPYITHKYQILIFFEKHNQKHEKWYFGQKTKILMKNMKKTWF